eukprot:jgi/Bigna1/126427/aug1.2_g1135
MSSQSVSWEWLDDYGWVPYSTDIAKSIEAARVSGTTFEFKHGSKRYVVDPKTLRQRNKKTGFRRKVRRVGGGGTKKVKSSTTMTKGTSKSDSDKAKGKSSPFCLPCRYKLAPWSFTFCTSTHQIDVKKITNYETIADPKSKQTLYDDTCKICMCDLDDEDMKPVVKLSKCVGHAFHLSCVEKAFQFSQSYMHPSPGESYSGTHRYAYLPDNEEGNRVCRLLMRGFEHGLLFTVGQSVTTGVKNTTIWNGIHHKTSTSGGVSNWGFPDARYFERVTNELASKGLFCEEFMAKEETARSKLKLKRQLSAEAKEMLSQSLTEGAFTLALAHKHE